MYENEFIELCPKKTPNKQKTKQNKNKNQTNKKQTKKRKNKKNKTPKKPLLFTSSIASIRAHNKSR